MSKQIKLYFSSSFLSLCSGTPSLRHVAHCPEFSLYPLYNTKSCLK